MLRLMKGLFVIAIATLFLAVAPLFAQTTAEKLSDVIDPSTVFESIAALAGVVLFITAWVKKKWNTKDAVTIVVSALISFIISGIGYYFKFGIFVAVEWYYIFIYGTTVMLVANGLSTWEFIKSILVLLRLRVPANKAK